MARPASRDAIYLQRLRTHYAKSGVLPSYAAIGAIVGLRSTSSVSALLGRLQTNRYVAIRDRRIVPLERFFERPLMTERVPAGMPAPFLCSAVGSRSIDAYLVRNPARTFLLEVQGDSMTNAGLLPGDTLVVETGTPARTGDIVVAAIEEAYTVKRLAREGRRLVLQPENASYPVLRPEPLEVVGVVVGAFRRYQGRP